MPALKSAAQAEKDKLEKTASYSLKNADRELSEEELEAESKAVKFSNKDYVRIKPIPGTLGFMLRNFPGGNHSVVEFITWATQDVSQQGGHNGRIKWVKEVIIIWKNMDEFSRRRVDIFDILCRKLSIPLKRFWGVMQEGLFDYNDQITQTALSGMKPAFVERLNHLASLDRHHQDRRLMAEALKLTGNQPLVSIEDKSVHQTLNVAGEVPSFSDSIRRSEENVRHTDLNFGQKKLTEGKQDYIDTEWADVPEKELVERKEANGEN